MLRWFKADLHIHTVLSPCAELSMGPKDIVKKALEHDIDIIAITDHNSAENVWGVMQAARNTPLTVIPGMEVYSRDEAHIVCLFGSLGDALAFQHIIYRALPAGDYDASFFGEQIICDENENIIAENNRLLALPVSLNVDKIADLIVEFNGIMIPAHVDRKAHSLLRTLSFMPNNLPVHAMEVAHSVEQAKKRFGILSNGSYGIIRSSDAHDIAQIGTKYTFFKMEKPSFTELGKAIRQLDGRRISQNKEK